MGKKGKKGCKTMVRFASQVRITKLRAINNGH